VVSRRSPTAATQQARPGQPRTLGLGRRRRRGLKAALADERVGRVDGRRINELRWHRGGREESEGAAPSRSSKGSRALHAVEGDRVPTTTWCVRERVSVPVLQLRPHPTPTRIPRHAGPAHAPRATTYLTPPPLAQCRDALTPIDGSRRGGSRARSAMRGRCDGKGTSKSCDARVGASFFLAVFFTLGFLWGGSQNFLEASRSPCTPWRPCGQCKGVQYGVPRHTT